MRFYFHAALVPYVFSYSVAEHFYDRLVVYQLYQYPQCAHLSHLQILRSVSSFILVSLKPLIHLIKIGGLPPSPSPIFHPGFVALPCVRLISPLCLWNVSAEERACTCSLWISHGMHHFRFTLRTLPVLIGGDYGVFIFLLGVGTQPVGTLPLWGRLVFFFFEAVTHTYWRTQTPIHTVN